MCFRRFGHSPKGVAQFLDEIGAMAAVTSHEWTMILCNHNFDDFINDERRGKRKDALWDCHPDLEIDTRLQFFVEECVR